MNILFNERAAEARAAYIGELRGAAISALAMARADERGANGGEETSLSLLLKKLLEVLGCTEDLTPAPPLPGVTDEDRRDRVFAAMGVFYSWLGVAMAHDAEEGFA